MARVVLPACSVVCPHLGGSTEHLRFWLSQPWPDPFTSVSLCFLICKLRTIPCWPVLGIKLVNNAQVPDPQWEFDEGSFTPVETWDYSPVKGRASALAAISFCPAWGRRHLLPGLGLSRIMPLKPDIRGVMGLRVPLPSQRGLEGMWLRRARSACIPGQQAAWSRQLEDRAGTRWRGARPPAPC